MTPSTVWEVAVSSAFLGFTAAASFDAVDLLSSGFTSWLVLAESDAESDAASIYQFVSLTLSMYKRIQTSFYCKENLTHYWMIFFAKIKTVGITIDVNHFSTNISPMYLQHSLWILFFLSLLKKDVWDRLIRFNIRLFYSKQRKLIQQNSTFQK